MKNSFKLSHFCTFALHGVVSGLAAIALLCPSSVNADSPHRAVDRGIQHYQSEEYDRAMAEFMAALEGDPDREESRYDLGAALYKLQDFPGAAQAFNQAAAKMNPRLGADAWYNLGNSLFKAGDAEKAIKAYKNALYLQHDHQDAKHNLELALMMRQMQQQQQQSSGQKDSTSQQKEEPQQKPEPKDEQEQQAGDEKAAQQDSLKSQQPEQQSEMSPEEALQLLQALENDEQEAQKEKLKRQFGQPKQVEKDW